MIRVSRLPLRTINQHQAESSIERIVLLLFVSGGQQHPLLRDHRRGTVRALPQHVRHQGAAERHGLHAQERPGRQQVRDLQVRRKRVFFLFFFLNPTNTTG